MEPNKSICPDIAAAGIHFYPSCMQNNPGWRMDDVHDCCPQTPAVCFVSHRDIGGIAQMIPQNTQDVVSYIDGV